MDAQVISPSMLLHIHVAEIMYLILVFSRGDKRRGFMVGCYAMGRAWSRLIL
jgi:hypothetical protein